MYTKYAARSNSASILSSLHVLINNIYMDLYDFYYYLYIKWKNHIINTNIECHISHIKELYNSHMHSTQ